MLRRHAILYLASVESVDTCVGCRHLELAYEKPDKLIENGGKHIKIPREGK